MTIEQARLRKLGAPEELLIKRRTSAMQLHQRALMRPDQQALLDGIRRLVERHQEGTVCEGSLYRRIVALHFIHSKRKLS